MEDVSNIRTKYDAIRTLISLGVMENINGADLYHGRAELLEENNKWEVRSDFINSGNFTGNKNVGKISCLYASEKGIAEKFAYIRARDKSSSGRFKYTGNVYSIKSIDDKGVVINSNFSIGNLSKEDLIKYYKALEILSRNETYFRPNLFTENFGRYGYKNDIILNINKIIRSSIRKQQAENNNVFEVDNYKVLMDLKKSNFANYLSIFGNNDNKILEHIDMLKSQILTRFLLSKIPNSVVDSYVNNSNVLRVSFRCGNEIKTENVKLDLSYVVEWCKMCGVLGYKQDVLSATLDGKEITVYMLFNLKKIMTKNKYDTIKRKNNDCFDLLESELSKENSIISDFVNLSNDDLFNKLYSKKYLRQIFEDDSGVWEGFSVREHTQAVMDFYDDYFRGSIPPKMTYFLKIIMLIHDIAKGVNIKTFSSQFGLDLDNLDKVEKYSKVSDLFLNLLGIQPTVKNFVKGIAFDSQYFTSKVIACGGDETFEDKAKQDLDVWCKKFACGVFGTNFNAKDMESLVKAIKYCAIILQECDSGAYTTYAKIKDQSTGEYMTGANKRFTNSFKIILDDSNGKVPRLKSFLDVFDM